MNRIKEFWAIILILSIFSCKEKEVSEPKEINPTEAALTLTFEHFFNDNPLFIDMDSVVTNAAGNQLNIRNLKYLISNITLITASDSFVKLKDVYGYINPGDDRNTLKIEQVPTGSYKAISFQLGLDSAINHSNPNQFAAQHPLNPNVNNMHWSWSGGYIFCTLEGECTNTPTGNKAFSYHIALNENKIPVRTPDFSFSIQKNSELIIRMQLDEAFKNPHLFDLTKEGYVSHSTNDKGLCNRLRDNLTDAFKVIEFK